MFYINDTNCHHIRPATTDYRTPKGEDDYYRHHSFTAPRPFADLRARLAALHLPQILHRTSHPTAPVLK